MHTHTHTPYYDFSKGAHSFPSHKVPEEILWPHGLTRKEGGEFNRIDQALYLILAVAPVWPFQLQSQEVWGAILGDRSYGIRAQRAQDLMPFPAGKDLEEAESAACHIRIALSHSGSLECWKGG